jgi:cold shock protein
VSVDCAPIERNAPRGRAVELIEREVAEARADVADIAPAVVVSNRQDQRPEIGPRSARGGEPYDHLFLSARGLDLEPVRAATRARAHIAVKRFSDGARPHNIAEPVKRPPTRREDIRSAIGWVGRGEALKSANMAIDSDQCPPAGICDGVTSFVGGRAMITGTVRSFDVHKGYGFIKPDGGGVDVLVDICAVERAEMDSLKQGQRLSFEIVYNESVDRSYAQNLIASEIRTPPLNAFSPITPLHDRRAIRRPQAPTVKIQERMQCATDALGYRESNPT